MRLANLADRLVLVKDDGTATDVERASDKQFSRDVQAVYDRWQEFTAWAERFDGDHGSLALDTELLGAPAPAPRQVFAVGLNYRSHALETGAELPAEPLIFTKFPSCITGPNGTVSLPGGDAQLDWEVELVAVMGRTARQVDSADAWSYVAGLTVGQDLTERRMQFSGGALPQFSLGKSYPGFGPIGPVLVTPDEFEDPDDLALGCSVNGQEMQNGRTGEMAFSVPELVARLSATVTLLPGDLIFTGTPQGAGIGRTPQRFLRSGDRLVSHVAGIGELHQYIR